MLQYSVDSEDLIPEGMTDYYEQKDGKYFLKVEGAVSKTKLDEFRNNNINLMKQRDDMNEKLESMSDIDPEIAREAIKLKDEMENKKLFDEGQFEELLAKNTDRIKKDNEKKIISMQEVLNKKEEELKTKSDMLSHMMIDVEVSKVLEQRPQLTTASKMLFQDRAKQSFHINGDGKIVFRQDEMKFNGDGEPYSVLNYIDDLINEHQTDPSFVKPSVGSGAVGSEGGVPGVTVGNVVRLTKADAQNPIRYRQAKAQATEQGKKLVLEG